MARRIAAAAAVLIAATGLTVAGTASSSALAAPRAAQPMIPAWRIVKQVHNGPFGGFSTVIAVGKNGGWAFNQGSVPTAWRRSGSTWTQVPFPGKSNETVVAAGPASPSDVWAFTAGGAQSRALRWNGQAWTVQRSFAQQIGGAVVISPSDVWALPGGPNRIFVDTVALIPGTTSVLAGGNTHAFAAPGTNVVAVLLQYGV